MGMTIDVQDPKAFAEWCKFIGAIPKADYENRLKADLVAMLTEIELEIEEMDSGCGWEGYRPTAQVIGLIQQRINSLKENEDGQKAK